MKCSYCTKDQNIVYKDWASKHNFLNKKPVTINLCFTCINDLDWNIEIKTILPDIRTCGNCQSKFLPKKKTQTKCGMCWKQYFRRIGK